LQAILANKKRSKKKGHVFIEICSIRVSQCGGGTSNILDLMTQCFWYQNATETTFWAWAVLDTYRGNSDGVLICGRRRNERKGKDNFEDFWRMVAICS